ncbi:hypothetical protein [Halobellus sp. GM3]|uniref:hypothetical protein n=1 Tax=Halobellus sp. GM3 TaxID=3458410 RepID=UPI00403D7753
MLNRRQVTLAIASAALGGAVASAGAFTSGSSAAADMRVVVVSELALTPARDDEAYVETDEEGEVTEIVLKTLNQRADSQFDRIALLTNNGDVTVDQVEFEFEVTDASGEREDVRETLRVTADGPVTTDGGVHTLLESSEETLAPGDSAEFGVAVNLLAERAPGGISDLPDEQFDVTLHVRAIRT